jgi:transposase
LIETAQRKSQVCTFFVFFIASLTGREEVNSINMLSTKYVAQFESFSYQIFVGIDIGYRTHVACACPGLLFNAKRYPDGWKRAKTFHFSSDAKGFKRLQRYLDTFSTNPAHFLILSEPTGGSYGMALQIYLTMKGYCLLQVENSAVKEYRENIYGSETKTDDTDARIMARMGFLHEWVGEEFSIQSVHIASPDESLIRLMSRDLMKLKKEINRRKNQLHQVLAFTFPELKTFFKHAITGPSARALIRKYPTPQELGKASVEEIAALFRLSRDHIHEKKAGELLVLAQNSVGVTLLSHHVWRQAWLLEQIDMLEPAWKELLSHVEQLIAAHPYTPIITSFPVKSPLWTATIISMVGTVERFRNYGEFRAYAGWYPKVEQSGTSVHSSSLANDGARNLRNVFGQMALMYLTPPYRTTAFFSFYQRLVARGMRKSAALGHVAGKLASVLYHCLKTMTIYDEKKHLQDMGFTKETDADNETTVARIPETSDTNEGQSDISEPAAFN